MHPAPRSRPLRRALIVSAALALVGCGSSSSDSEPAATPTEQSTPLTEAGADGSTRAEAGKSSASVPATATDTGEESEATLSPEMIAQADQLAEVDPDFDICGVIPTLGEISNEVGIEFTMATPNIDPLGDSWVCDVSGDSTTFVVFERMAFSLGTAMVVAMTADGQLVDPGTSEVPGAVAYANTVAVERGGYFYSVQFIDPFAGFNAPQSLGHAARLLITWLGIL